MEDTQVILMAVAISVVYIAGLWATFVKAGAPGWASLVPIYNVWTLIKVARDEGWKIVLLLIPVVNVIYFVLLSIRVANAFGRSAAFGWGLLLLGPVFYPILGFGGARYRHEPVG